jgi:tRNA (adenine-N(1)-)-methyltransferase non-catalytic subunit
VGQPYGLTYEVVDKKLKVLPPHAVQEVGRPNCACFLVLTLPIHHSIEDTSATNEYINDGEFVQPLALQEIQALKQAGVHASVRLLEFICARMPKGSLFQDIIKKQIELHANYSLKTEYSKEKYKKRKEAK